MQIAVMQFRNKAKFFFSKGDALKTKTNSGFSLVELLVVIAILGIVSAVAIPGLLSWVPDYRLRSASRELHDNMQMARISAIKARQACYINFNSPGVNQYTVIQGAKTLKSIDLEEYGSNVQFSAAPARITFQFNGLADSTKTAEVTNNDKTYKATVFISGSIKLQES